VEQAKEAEHGVGRGKKLSLLRWSARSMGRDFLPF